MKKRKWLVFGILGLVMVIGLTGCIISTSPDTGNVIEMNPGDTKVFKVSGVNLNSSISKCVWSIDRMNGNDPEYLEGIDQVELPFNGE